MGAWGREHKRELTTADTLHAQSSGGQLFHRYKRGTSSSCVSTAGNVARNKEGSREHVLCS